VIAAGVDALIVHARKAWLSGLSPRENRDIPPLDYPIVYRLKAEHPELPIVINGGVTTIEAALEHLKHVDGVMMGRAAYQEPWRLLDVDPLVFGEAAPHQTVKSAAASLIPYIEKQIASGAKLHSIVRHLHGLFHAVPGARAYRRHLAIEAVQPGACAAVLAEALALVVDTPREEAQTAAA
jgi:tRNA-dihydrouridine synthase A